MQKRYTGKTPQTSAHTRNDSCTNDTGEVIMQMSNAHTNS